MPASDIVNRNAQFFLGTEEAVRTTSIFKIIPCNILGVYALNDCVLEISVSPYYKWLEGKKRGGFGGFIRYILVEGGLFGDAHSRQNDRSTLNQTGINISVYPTVTDPFFHTCIPFNSGQDISRHQKQSCDWQREGINQCLSILDCIPFFNTDKLIDTLHAMITIWVVSTLI